MQRPFGGIDSAEHESNHQTVVAGCLDMALLPALPPSPIWKLHRQFMQRIIQPRPFHSDTRARLLNHTESDAFPASYSYSGNPNGLLGVFGADQEMIDEENAETDSS